MQARFSHIALMVSCQRTSRDFYLAALGPLGFAVADELPRSYARISNGTDTVIVLSEAVQPFASHGYHRKRIGIHHVALAVESRATIDAMAAHLEALRIPLAGLGRVELGYRGDYYCLLFEDPDRILIELAYHGPAYFELLPER